MYPNKELKSQARNQGGAEFLWQLVRVCAFGEKYPAKQVRRNSRLQCGVCAGRDRERVDGWRTGPCQSGRPEDADCFSEFEHVRAL
jgi:hypothetical protein